MINLRVNKHIKMSFINDQSTHFCNRQIEALSRKYIVLHKVSTPYHPLTNGQAKISNRKLKQIHEKISPTKWKRLDKEVGKCSLGL